MGYELWGEDELKSLAENSMLLNLVKTLGIDAEKWTDSAIAILPETLRVTGSRSVM